MNKTYNIQVNKRPARPRSKRRRENGTGTVVTAAAVSAAVGGSGSGSVMQPGHEHSNLDTLERLGEQDGYMTLHDAETGMAEKVKAGYSDKAGYANKADEARNLAADSPVRDEFLNKKRDDRSTGKIASDKAVEVGRFVSGVSGAIISVDADTGRTYAEVDDLTVRCRALFEQLEILNASSVGGRLYVTPGGSVKCCKVEETPDGWRCYYLSGQGEVKTECLMKAGDMAISETFDTKTGQRRYWRLVIDVDSDAETDDAGNHYGYVELSEQEGESGGDIPEPGDVICQLGYSGQDDPQRQSAVIISAAGADAPSIKLLAGIGTFSLAGKDRLTMGYAPETGRMSVKCYGDAYTGARDGSTYVKYDEERRLTEIKAALDILSTVDGRTLEDITSGRSSVNLVKNSARRFYTADSSIADNFITIRDWAVQLEKGKTYTVRAVSDGKFTNNHDQAIKDANPESEDVCLWITKPGSYSQIMGGLTAATSGYTFTWTRDSGEHFIRFDSHGRQHWVERIMLVEGEYISPGWVPAPGDEEPLDYVRRALTENARVQGGLVLVSLMKLGYTARDGEWVPTAGISGLVTEGGNDPAVWAGGDMVDAEKLPDEGATFMVRHDGTFYWARGDMRGTKHGLWVGRSVYLDKEGLKLLQGGEERLSVVNRAIDFEALRRGALSASGNDSGAVTVKIGVVSSAMAAEPLYDITEGGRLTVWSGQLDEGASMVLTGRVALMCAEDMRAPMMAVTIRREGVTAPVLTVTAALSRNGMQWSASVPAVYSATADGMYTVETEVFSAYGDQQVAGAVEAAVNTDWSYTTNPPYSSKTILGNNGFATKWGDILMYTHEGEASLLHSAGPEVSVNRNGVRLFRVKDGVRQYAWLNLTVPDNLWTDVPATTELTD